MVAATKPASAPDDRGRLHISPLGLVDNGDEGGEPAQDEHRRFHKELLYQCTFTVSGELLELIEEARHLLSHAIPSGNSEQILVRAMHCLIAQVRKDRFAVPNIDSTADRQAFECEVDSFRDDSRTQDEPTEMNCSQGETDSPQGDSSQHESIGTQGRHVPSRVKRIVYLRDEGKCAFIGLDGCRCESKFQLEIHHMVAFGRGGSHRPNNLELRCKNHNHLASIFEYGQEVADHYANQRAAAEAST